MAVWVYSRYYLEDYRSSLLRYLSSRLTIAEFSSYLAVEAVEQVISSKDSLEGDVKIFVNIDSIILLVNLIAAEDQVDIAC